ncbi:SAM-dependent methyltransferase [Formosimonas limnophila]|uniref:SAM-dependent methyltransferase n=1 Tax=Formosimonas limnophila TaxID=1384487 RepID=A0A8J3CGG6_9BURK|nr:SAM-dependent methyltransferase [Formosimonas limnophila]GHA70039.1 SAM-dependent methyltransferase [Formosimonas limnophila]
MSASLPTPSAAQISRSADLVQHIIQLINAHQGWLPFDEYMNAALYTPRLGYYSNDGSPFSEFGVKGDFITAPLLSPLFGACVAEQALEVFERIGSNQMLEIGAGTGQLAADVLTHLAKSGVKAQYYILELSATLRAQQQATLADVGFHNIIWLDALPVDFEGLIVGNEVLDAMPVKLVGMKLGDWFERGVVHENGQLKYADRSTTERLPTSDSWQAALRESGATYLSETQHQQAAFIKSLALCLKRGVVLMIDYGFPAKELYHPQRNTGTLMCHIQHVAHDDALYYPGVQDITAHVNFSALKEAGCLEHLFAVGYTNQANFLINTGLLNLLSQIEPEQQRIHANRVSKLLSEAEMGELFKVMAWQKGLGWDENDALLGFERGDRIDSL